MYAIFQMYNWQKTRNTSDNSWAGSTPVCLRDSVNFLASFCVRHATDEDSACGAVKKLAPAGRVVWCVYASSSALWMMKDICVRSRLRWRGRKARLYHSCCDEPWAAWWDTLHCWGDSDQPIHFNDTFNVTKFCFYLLHEDCLSMIDRRFLGE